MGRFTLSGMFDAFVFGLCEIAPFGIGGAVGIFLVSSRKCDWRFFAAASLIYLAYFPLLLALPFWGFLSEVALLVAAGAAMVLPMSIFWIIARQGRNISRRKAFVALFWLPLTAAVMSTNTDRINYARWLKWSCNGPILEVTRASGNHNLPTLVVRDARGKARFVNVDEPLWARAKPGQLLAKAAGSPNALLDGRHLRMVPRQLGWWNEPH